MTMSMWQRRRARNAMISSVPTAICLIISCAVLLATAPLAAADEPVTYEVVSDSVGIANVEYQDANGRATRIGVALPWRVETSVQKVQSGPPDGAQVRADWRPRARPNSWVSVRISHRGKIICQNTLDVGNAACYGNTPRIT